MRERKLRSAAESLERLKGSAILNYILYKIRFESKSENAIRICSSGSQCLKQQWNQMFWLNREFGYGITGHA